MPLLESFVHVNDNDQPDPQRADRIAAIAPEAIDDRKERRIGKRCAKSKEDHHPAHGPKPWSSGSSASHTHSTDAYAWGRICVSAASVRERYVTSHHEAIPRERQGA